MGTHTPASAQKHMLVHHSHHRRDGSVRAILSVHLVADVRHMLEAGGWCSRHGSEQRAIEQLFSSVIAKDTGYPTVGGR